jgi:DNA invertase Pin-like site-specific DNA recombinase
MSKTVISYVRVSTTGQGRSGLGLEAQREAIARFCKTQNYAIGDEYLEVESGKLEPPPPPENLCIRNFF